MSLLRQKPLLIISATLTLLHIDYFKLNCFSVLFFLQPKYYYITYCLKRLILSKCQFLSEQAVTVINVSDPTFDPTKGYGYHRYLRQTV